MDIELKKQKQREASARWRANNPLTAEQKALNVVKCKEWRAKQDKEVKRQKAHHNYNRRRNEAIAKSKQYRIDNDVSIKASRKAKKDREPWAIIFHALKTRAKKNNIVFDIDVEYLKSIWNVRCPIYDIELNGRRHEDWRATPSVDRIWPDKGYVKGNVLVVSHLANTAKYDRTPKELQEFVPKYNRKITTEEFEILKQFYKQYI